MLRYSLSEAEARRCAPGEQWRDEMQEEDGAKHSEKREDRWPRFC